MSRSLCRTRPRMCVAWPSLPSLHTRIFLPLSLSRLPSQTPLPTISTITAMDAILVAAPAPSSQTPTLTMSATTGRPNSCTTSTVQRLGARTEWPIVSTVNATCDCLCVTHTRARYSGTGDELNRQNSTHDASVTGALDGAERLVMGNFKRCSRRRTHAEARLNALCMRR